MIKVICIVLAAILTIGIVGTMGFMIVKTVGYMINQHFDIGTAIQWSWTDFTDFVRGIFGGGAKAEDPNHWETTYTVNQHIDVVACTSL